MVPLPSWVQSPSGVIDCDVDILTATPTVLHLQNQQKIRNFIQAEMTEQNWLKYYVENLPKDGTGCPGRWLFELAWQHLSRHGTIQGIRGDWTFGDNLRDVNRLTAGGSWQLEDAIRRTWGFARATSKGFPTLQILDVNGQPGRYRSIDVLFLP